MISRSLNLISWFGPFWDIISCFFGVRWKNDDSVEGFIFISDPVIVLIGQQMSSKLFLLDADLFFREFRAELGLLDLDSA